MEHHALSALIRRSGPEMRRRAMVFLFCLRSLRLRADGSTPQGMNPEDDDSGTQWGSRLSLNCIVFLTNALIGFDHMPPRFVFAVGPSCAVLRSADRGKTWRKLDPKKSAIPASDATKKMEGAADTATASNTEDSDAATTRQLNEILSLLPQQDEEDAATEASPPTSTLADDEADDEAVATSSATPPPINNATANKQPQASRPDLLCVACSADMVALGGQDGFLALSLDRGVTFNVVDSSACMSVLRDRTRSKHQFFPIRGLHFLDDHTLVFHSMLHLCRIRYRQTSLTAVAWEPAASLIKFPKGSIGTLLVSHSHLHGVDEPSIWVSSMGALHLSRDRGRTFSVFPHSLGLIRRMVPIGGVSPSPRSSPAHPCWGEALDAAGVRSVCNNDAMAPQAPPSSSLGGEVANATTNTTTTAEGSRKSFSYSVSSKLTTTIAAHADRVMEAFEVPMPTMPEGKGRFPPKAVAAPQPYNDSTVPAGVGYLRFAVLCVGGRIVPYDFTAVVHLVVSRDDCAPDVLLQHTTASHVSFIPFVESGSQEHVGLAATQVRSDDVGSRVVLMRSTTSGVSVTPDYGTTWSAPSRSYTGTCVSLDAGCFVAVSLRKSVVISEDAGSTFVTHALPTALRVATLNDVAVMF